LIAGNRQYNAELIRPPDTLQEGEISQFVTFLLTRGSALFEKNIEIVKTVVEGVASVHALSLVQWGG
jgi:hypothetical protein